MSFYLFIGQYELIDFTFTQGCSCDVSKLYKCLTVMSVTYLAWYFWHKCLKIIQKHTQMFMSMGWDYVSTLRPLTGQLFMPQVMCVCGKPRWSVINRSNRRIRRKTCPSATFSTSNPTWTDPGLRGQRLAVNRLSHGTALHTQIKLYLTYLKRILLLKTNTTRWKVRYDYVMFVDRFPCQPEVNCKHCVVCLRTGFWE
jgi:hypothetical protein